MLGTCETDRPPINCRSGGTILNLVRKNLKSINAKKGANLSNFSTTCFLKKSPRCNFFLTRVVQRGVLKYAHLHNDWQTCLVGVMQQPNVLFARACSCTTYSAHQFQLGLDSICRLLHKLANSRTALANANTADKSQLSPYVPPD